MYFDSLLLSRPTRWDFPGVLELNNWVIEKPWENEGGVYVVSVPKDYPIDGHFNAMYRLVCSYSDGERIRGKFLNLTDSGSTLRQALGDVIDWRPIDGRHSFREKLRQYQASTTGLIYFVLTGQPTDLDEAFAMADFCSKAGTQCPFTIFVFSTCSDDSAATRFINMKTGWLNEQLFHDLGNKTELDLWNSYNYQRFTWEAGGSPNIVKLMEQRFLDSGSLDRCERITENAIVGVAKELKTINQSKLAELAAFLADGRQIGYQSDEAEILANEFATLGLLWRPRQCNDWILPGWVARAFMDSKFICNQWLVRRSLNCLTITGDILVACISLEMRLRQKYVMTLNENQLSEDAIGKYTTWIQGGDREFVCYSTGAEPRKKSEAVAGKGVGLEDAWIFSSLGDIQIALKNSQPQGRHSRNFLDAINRLRLLRNSLAHSHPIAWNHIVMLKKISSLL